MKKLNKLNYLLIGVFLLIICVFLLTETYSLFETNASSNSVLEVGVWRIELNDTDISLAQTITLDDFTYSQSTHTEDGYFAPGRTAEFILEIDTSDCDVSVSYDLEIDDSSLDDYPNINFKIQDPDTLQILNTNTFSGVIPLSAPSKVIRIKIILEWDNILQYDESDTSLIGEELEFLIDANFTQYLGV